MMTNVSVEREGSHFRLKLSQPQRALIYSVLELLSTRDSDLVVSIQVGCDRSDLNVLRDRLTSQSAEVFSTLELHVIHAALTVAWNQFTSEEAFYTRIGFFKEHAIAVAAGLVRAIQHQNDVMEESTTDTETPR